MNLSKTDRFDWIHKQLEPSNGKYDWNYSTFVSFTMTPLVVNRSYTPPRTAKDPILQPVPGDCHGIAYYQSMTYRCFKILRSLRNRWINHVSIIFFLDKHVSRTGAHYITNITNPKTALFSPDFQKNAMTFAWQAILRKKKRPVSYDWRPPGGPSLDHLQRGFEEHPPNSDGHWSHEQTIGGKYKISQV